MEMHPSASGPPRLPLVRVSGADVGRCGRFRRAPAGCAGVAQGRQPGTRALLVHVFAPARRPTAPRASAKPLLQTFSPGNNSRESELFSFQICLAGAKASVRSVSRIALQSHWPGTRCERDALLSALACRTGGRWDERAPELPAHPECDVERTEWEGTGTHKHSTDPLRIRCLAHLCHHGIEPVERPRWLPFLLQVKFGANKNATRS